MRSVNINKRYLKKITGKALQKYPYVDRPCIFENIYYMIQISTSHNQCTANEQVLTRDCQLYHNIQNISQYHSRWDCDLYCPYLSKVSLI